MQLPARLDSHEVFKHLAGDTVTKQGEVSVPLVDITSGWFPELHFSGGESIISKE